MTFQNYITIDINYGIKKEYIESFPRFMTSIINSSKSEVEALKAMTKANRKRYRLVNVLEVAIDASRKIPTPAKRILKDRLFYKTCIHSILR